MRIGLGWVDGDGLHEGVFTVDVAGMVLSCESCRCYMAALGRLCAWLRL